MSTVFELVWVRNNLTSSAKITLASTDFNSPPAAPVGLSATREPNTTDPSNVTVDLSWTDASNTETGFDISYSDDGGGTWSAPLTVAPAIQAYSVTAPRGVTRAYRIRSENTFGQSAWVNAAAISIPWLVRFDSQGGSAVTGEEVSGGAMQPRRRTRRSAGILWSVGTKSPRASRSGTSPPIP